MFLKTWTLEKIVTAEGTMKRERRQTMKMKDQLHLELPEGQLENQEFPYLNFQMFNQLSLNEADEIKQLREKSWINSENKQQKRYWTDSKTEDKTTKTLVTENIVRTLRIHLNTLKMIPMR